MSQVEYQTLLENSRFDHRKIEDMTQSLLAKIIIDKLVVDFELVNMFRTIGGKFPPIAYVDHVEMILISREMVNLELPSRDQWKTIEKFGKTKYRYISKDFILRP